VCGPERDYVGGIFRRLYDEHCDLYRSSYSSYGNEIKQVMMGQICG
jgi:hypothetical protein